MTEQDFKLLPENEQIKIVRDICNTMLICYPENEVFSFLEYKLLGVNPQSFKETQPILATIDKLKEYVFLNDYIERHPVYNVKYRFTEKGKKVKKSGGLFEFEKSELKKEKELLNEKKRKKYLDYLGIGGGVIGIISGMFGVLVYFGVISKEEPNSKEIQTMQKRIELLTSKIESFEKNKSLEEKKPTKEINNLQD